MGRIILNSDLKAKLHGLKEALEVFDESGQALGYFLPMDEYHKRIRAKQDIPFSDEELDKFRNAGGGGPLADFWKRM
jgi:hypothetical protein